MLGASANIAAVARGLGCEVILVQKPGRPVEPMVEKRKISHLYSVDFTAKSFPSFVDRVLRVLRVSAVVSVTEEGLLPAAVANEMLGLPGSPPAVVERLRDKALMRQALLQRAPGLSVGFACPRDAEQAARAVRSWGADHAIVKPRQGTASLGVRLLPVDALATVTEWSDLLIEEYVPGPEFSAESFSTGGRHRLIAVAEKRTGDGFVELAHVVPPIAPLDVAAIAAGITAFLDAVGLRDGPAHTEFKLAPEGMKVIESHNRIGGDGIPGLVRAVTGIDLKAWSVGWPIGLGAPADRPSPTAAAAAVAFATAKPGTVREVSLPQTDESTDYLWAVQPGDVVRELRSSADRVGGVAVFGDDPGSALAKAKSFAAQIRVVT